MRPSVPSLQGMGTLFRGVSENSFLHVIPWPCRGGTWLSCLWPPHRNVRLGDTGGRVGLTPGCAESAPTCGQVASQTISALEPTDLAVGRIFRSLAGPTLKLSISSCSNHILLCLRLHLALTALLLRSVASTIDTDVPIRNHCLSC